MRQFMTTQRVHLVTTESTIKYYQSKLKLQNGPDIECASLLTTWDLIKLSTMNQNEKEIIGLKTLTKNLRNIRQM